MKYGATKRVDLNVSMGSASLLAVFIVFYFLPVANISPVLYSFPPILHETRTTTKKER